MNHSDLKDRLNSSWARSLEQWGSLSSEDLTRPLTVSLADPDLYWSAQDHLVHVYGAEKLFQIMIGRFLSSLASGEVAASHRDPTPPTKEDREAFFKRISVQNDKWILKHRDKGYAEVIRLGEGIRAKSMDLIDQCSAEQLLLAVPGASGWGGGSIAGVIGFNDEHAQLHWDWIQQAQAEMKDSGQGESA